MITTNSRVRVSQSHSSWSEPKADITPPLVCGTASQAAVESILLGLNMRGWLTETEKNLLDLMTGPGMCMFLAHDGEIFQPSGNNRFTMELASTALMSGGLSIYSQRHRVSDDQHEATRRVHTALLEAESEKPIVLGMAEADSDRDGFLGDSQFPDLLNRFRTGAQIVRLLLPRVRQLTDQDTPVMLVNRSSGRIVAVNKSFSALLNREDLTIADREFGQIKRELLSLLPGSIIKMQNITHGALNLATIEIRPLLKKNNVDTADPFMVDFFTHKMRNKIAAITTAASHLDATNLDEGKTDQSELTRIILREVAEMDSYLSRLNLIVNYPLLKATLVSLSDELQQALRAVRQSTSTETVINLTTVVPTVTILHPQHAIVYLVEACLWAQLFGRRQPGRTEVSVHRSDDNNSTIVQIDTLLNREDSRIALNANWSSFAQRLASTMSVGLSQDSLPNQHGLSTQITFSDDR